MVVTRGDSLMCTMQFQRRLVAAEKDGGDDGTRTRGLCRDRVTGRCNLLEINGTDSPFLIL